MINWQANGYDDFIATQGDYFFHVEKLQTLLWWVGVDYKGKEIHTSYHLSEREAKEACEELIRKSASQ